MSGLTHSLSISVKSLLAQQSAIETTSNNIANVNTPGYSRQRTLLSQEDPVRFGSLWFGSGVGVDGVTSVRDRVLEFRLDQETQQMARLDAYLGALAPIEAEFNDAAGAGLEDAMSRFFNSLLELSADPSNLPLRQSVLASADRMTAEFQRTAERMEASLAGLDRNVRDAIDQINEITPRIAELNRRISGLEGVGQEAGALEDERHMLIRRLSELVDVSVAESDTGLTVSTIGGMALVAGGAHVPVSAEPAPGTGRYQVLVADQNITTSIREGQLGGLIEARDRTAPAVLADLDRLAFDLANAINTAHQAGFDLDGASGGDFFAPPAALAGAARGFAVAITDPRQLAASLDGSAGGNGNLLAMTAVREQNTVDGRTPADFYGSLLVDIGNEVSHASAERDVRSLVLRQLENQRSALSGVSLDEEAANLIRYQQAFQAAARVVSVVDELTEIAVNLGRN